MGWEEVDHEDLADKGVRSCSFVGSFFVHRDQKVGMIFLMLPGPQHQNELD
jgi:hypothetical protein